jgi:DNA repair protein RecN (Recombination protein N)
MLRFLRITRLAVIDAVEVEFAPGLNVLTGETGAGKSILVGAVGLLLGGRASGDLVRTGEDSATVEAIFVTPAGEELIVRREVTAQGRSRAYVNGALVTAAVLKEAAAGLVELHGQHEHQTLLDPATHLAVLDAFGALDGLKVPVRELFELLQETSQLLDQARKAALERETRLDIVRFQLAELEKADPAPGEDDRLVAERQVLANADRLERLCAASYGALYERDGSIMEELSTVWRQVAELASIEPRFGPYLESRDSIKAQLEDLAMFIRHYGDRIDASPGRLQHVEERLALLERLKRKYGRSLDDLIARRGALRQELGDLGRVEERVEELERARDTARSAFLREARALSRARRGAAVRFAHEIERELGDLAMERTRFQLQFSEEVPEDRWTSMGVDEAEFFVSPNPGEELRPLARVVSGGELSRIMLAIKTLGALARAGKSEAAGASIGAAAGRGAEAGPRDQGNERAAGLIFDEVDAGIGGAVADVVGRKLAALGERFQVLCITHLPQIAAYAGAHFHISKAVAGGRTQTTVIRLDDEDRVDEIGRMLGGAVLSDGIRASARELLARGGTVLSQDRGTKAKGESERAKAKAAKASESERRGTR